MGEPDRVFATVREASDQDVPPFVDFLNEAWRQSGPRAPGFAGATNEIIAELTTDEAVRARIGGPDRRMFLAWSGDRVVGFAATKRIDADTVELAGIIVLPSSAGRGVGTQLVQTAMRAMDGESYQTMIVRTETTNQAARGFYEARGFTLERMTVERVDDTSVEVCELSRSL